jgi:hypothetical protein
MDLLEDTNVFGKHTVTIFSSEDLQSVRYDTTKDTKTDILFAAWIS